MTSLCELMSQGRFELSYGTGSHGSLTVLPPSSYELAYPLEDKDWVHVPVYHREEV